MKEILSVGIGEYKVSQSPNTLRTILGSCVGVLIYDPVSKIGGLAHVYLPLSKDYHNERRGGIANDKYADILLPKMIEDMLEKGANKRHFISYLVGGATLFNIKPDSSLNIGEKNLQVVKEILQNLHITFFQLQVGGNTGRRVFFNLINGDIDVTDLKKH
ncbi:MAG: chemotaxis protein CheD [Spirochaetales bacterium]|nr:chemotaxis protein CheD [Spirochaetales bacterium]